MYYKMEKIKNYGISKLNPAFLERMKEILESEYDDFCSYCEKPLLNSIRCNTLKISVSELKTRLEKKWKIAQPYKEHPEIMIIVSELAPGEIGKAIEHTLGYYYVQDISSMMPSIALSPEKSDIVLDLCASPGSKTSQIAAIMENSGAIIANDLNLGRISILSTNLQRCGVTNAIITRSEGANLCAKIIKKHLKFDKILVDAPCSGEGTIRASKKPMVFSENIIRNLSGLQKLLLVSAIKTLKVGGEIVYSTCTYAPEENERVISYVLDNYPVEIMKIEIPVKTKQGMTEWKGEKFNENVKKCSRIYPQDNNTEGFFLAKLKKVGECEE